MGFGVGEGDGAGIWLKSKMIGTADCLGVLPSFVDPWREGEDTNNPSSQKGSFNPNVFVSTTSSLSLPQPLTTKAAAAAWGFLRVFPRSKCSCRFRTIHLFVVEEIQNPL